MSSIRKITEGHAHNIANNFESLYCESKFSSSDIIIGETDGTMIPIVKEKKGLDKQEDKRKNKDLFYREARLSLAYSQGEVKPFYHATLGDKHATGKQLKWCAKMAGMDEISTIHCVGDGATWIADQVTEQFGTQGEYLIDFYHLCDYLGNSSKKIQPDKDLRKRWMSIQKNRMKQNKKQLVLDELNKHMDKNNNEDPVFCCYRYIKNRPDQFDYKYAIDNDLPIGSGKVESGHRYVIQKRLKIPGAWWKEDNAQDMLALRALIANDNWEEYWKKLKN